MVPYLLQTTAIVDLAHDRIITRGLTVDSRVARSSLG
jgi:hypothetical protein